MITMALLIAAFVLFVIAAIGIPSGRFSLLAAGLGCWVLSSLVGHL
jgi:hypothetical protein